MLAFSSAALLLTGCVCTGQGSDGSTSGQLTYSFGSATGSLALDEIDRSYEVLDGDANLYEEVTFPAQYGIDIALKITVPTLESGLHTREITVCACTAPVVGTSEEDTTTTLPPCSWLFDLCETAHAVVVAGVSDIQCKNDVCEGQARANINLLDGGLGIRGTLDVWAELHRQDATCAAPGLIPF